MFSVSLLFPKYRLLLDVAVFLVKEARLALKLPLPDLP